jgi:hypothetical protein
MERREQSVPAGLCVILPRTCCTTTFAGSVALATMWEGPRPTRTSMSSVKELLGGCRSSTCLAGCGARLQRGLDASPADPRAVKWPRLGSSEFLDPVLDTFMRALPKTYEALEGDAGATVVVVGIRVPGTLLLQRR